MTAGPEPREASATGDLLRAGLLIAGFAALVVAPFAVPNQRTRELRNPHAAAISRLLAIQPGMRRSVLESTLHGCYRRPDGVEVFSLPDSDDQVRLDVRLGGPGQDAPVTAVGDPYFAPYPQPDHLR